jgi:pilus assembly protein CpaE
MSTYLINSNLDAEKAKIAEGKIRSAISDLVRLGSLDEVVQKLSTNPEDKSYVLAIASSADHSYFARLTELALRFRDRACFVLISEDIPATDYKRLVRTGGADWVSFGSVPQEILDLMSRHRAGADQRASGGKDAVVVCFAPSAGGVGNTTLAVEVAAHLKTNKATKARAICVVDLDFQTSHVCDHLDIEPRLQIHEISNNPERLDEQLFDIFISRHSCGLDVFAAPRAKFDLCDIRIEALDLLFDMISSRYDLVLVDTPVAWFKWTFNVLSACDAVVVTGINTIPGLRQMAETVTTVRDMRSVNAHLAVAVNRCRRRAFGGIERGHHVEKVLGREQVFFVGEDPAVLQAANAGTPVMLSGATTAVGKEIVRLAAFCADLKPARVKSG